MKHCLSHTKTQKYLNKTWEDEEATATNKRRAAEEAPSVEAESGCFSCFLFSAGYIASRVCVPVAKKKKNKSEGGNEQANRKR